MTDCYKKIFFRNLNSFSQAIAVFAMFIEQKIVPLRTL